MRKRVSFRIDFEMEILTVDETTNKIKFAMWPRPDRYEWQVIDGKKMLHDRLDDIFFPENVVDRFAKGLQGAPVGFETSEKEVWNFEEYVTSRLQEIEQRSLGRGESFEFTDKSEDFLESLSINKLEFAILSIDIKDSSVLSNNLDPDSYERIVETFVYEISELVPKFHGYVLKYQGDGLIAYFPAPSFIIKNDLAMECALDMRKLVYLGLNPVFLKVGLPTIDVRIGLEAGEAYVCAIGSPSAKRHMDIIGEIVNLATKVQSLAGPGGVTLGDATYRHLHTSWRHLCIEMELPENWKYKNSGAGPYKVFRVQFKSL